MRGSSSPLVTWKGAFPDFDNTVMWTLDETGTKVAAIGNSFDYAG